MPAECLAVDKRLPSNTRQRVERRRNQQQHGARDQRRRRREQAEPLHNGHDEVHGGAEVVGLEAADEGVEVGGGRADSEEQRDFDEEDDEGADAAKVMFVSV